MLRTGSLGEEWWMILNFSCNILDGDEKLWLLRFVAVFQDGRGSQDTAPKRRAMDRVDSWSISWLASEIVGFVCYLVGDEVPR